MSKPTMKENEQNNGNEMFKFEDKEFSNSHTNEIQYKENIEKKTKRAINFPLQQYQTSSLISGLEYDNEKAKSLQCNLDEFKLNLNKSLNGEHLSTKSKNMTDIFIHHKIKKNKIDGEVSITSTIKSKRSPIKSNNEEIRIKIQSNSIKHSLIIIDNDEEESKEYKKLNYDNYFRNNIEDEDTLNLNKEFLTIKKRGMQFTNSLKKDDKNKVNINLKLNIQSSFNSNKSYKRVSFCPKIVKNIFESNDDDELESYVQTEKKSKFMNLKETIQLNKNEAKLKEDDFYFLIRERLKKKIERRNKTAEVVNINCFELNKNGYIYFQTSKQKNEFENQTKREAFSDIIFHKSKMENEIKKENNESTQSTNKENKKKKISCCVIF